MRAIAEGFVVALAAATEAERGAPGEIELLARGVYDFEIAFDSERAVIVDGNSGWHSARISAHGLLYKWGRACESETGLLALF